MTLPKLFSTVQVSPTWSIVTCGRCGAQFSFPTAKLTTTCANIDAFLNEHCRQPYCSERAKLSPRT